MINPALREALAAFDDAALATLANPGLVRRAHRDVEEGKVRLVSANAEGAEIEADGQAVSLGPRGPAASPCTCRSVAVCRHRIAAVIFLRTLEDAPGAEPAGGAEEAGDPAEIVTAFDLARLERWAGKAAWRAAIEMAGTALAVEPGTNAVAVTFPDVEGPVRILRGQGADGIVSKASKARIKACHAAAVLAALRHFGHDLPDVAEAEVAEPSGTVEIDPDFLARVAAALREVAATGMNLAPLPLEESLFELSVSSRADALPRLAALLRAIAAQMRLRRGRALDFDPDRMLELAATAQALLHALPTSEGDRRVALAGKVRRDFAPAEPLHLVGCGGERWRTTSGARGVTAWFVEPTSGRWLSTTLARGAGQDPAFVPAEAWRAQPMWQAEPLAVLAHARIALEGSRRSSDDRLSAPASARATVITRGVRPQPDWPGVVHGWDALQQVWLDHAGLGLDSVETATACLIAPERIASPFFDELAQRLIWPVRDGAGRWLALSIDHEDAVSPAIEALEANVKIGWQGMILVRIAREEGALEVRPITLFGAGDPVDLSLWQRPWRPREQGGLVRGWMERLRMDGGRRFAALPRGASDMALARAWRHLLDRAEVGPALAATLGGELAAHAARLDLLGMVSLAALVRGAGEEDGLLAAAYALMLARQQRCAVPLLA